jgi:hypothetical protein
MFGRPPSHRWVWCGGGPSSVRIYPHQAGIHDFRCGNQVGSGRRLWNLPPADGLSAAAESWRTRPLRVTAVTSGLSRVAAGNIFREHERSVSLNDGPDASAPGYWRSSVGHGYGDLPSSGRARRGAPWTTLYRSVRHRVQMLEGELWPTSRPTPQQPIRPAPRWNGPLNCGN